MYVNPIYEPSHLYEICLRILTIEITYKYSCIYLMLFMKKLADITFGTMFIFLGEKNKKELTCKKSGDHLIYKVLQDLILSEKLKKGKNIA